MPVPSAAKSQLMLIFSATPRDRVVAMARAIAETRMVVSLLVYVLLLAARVLVYGKTWFEWFRDDLPVYV